MNFFKSVFAAEETDSPASDSKPSTTQSPSEPDPDYQPPSRQNPNPNPVDATTTNAAGLWSFGGLIKTLSTKSDSVIEIYRRDLKEFGSGLKKEIEVAHGSLENVGHAFDEISTTVLKSTAQIISQGKEAILAADLESDSSDNNNERSIVSPYSLNSRPYSRFETHVRAIQGDAGTYCEEPEDLDDFEKWKAGFNLEEKREEVDSLIEENSVLESIYRRVVPSSIDEETFWCRYYYKVYKLKLTEDLRANLVKRAISREEEDLSWDVDDYDDDNDAEKETDNDVHKHREGEKQPNLKENEDSDAKNSATDEREDEKTQKIVRSDEQTESVKENESVNEDIPLEEPKSKDSSTSSSDEKVESGKSEEEIELKYDQKSGQEGKGDKAESSKDSDVSVILSHPSNPEEEDLGWDEIEDLSSIDEKKGSHSGSPKIADSRKRLSSAAEEEDLSWDIEDDDEPVKA